jgi:ACS family hexuronate transporter-like MFS transporter
VLFAVLMLAAIPAVLVTDVRLSIALVAVAMAGYTGWVAVTFTFPGEVFPTNLVGSIWGLASMGAGFGGMVFTLIMGWVVDHYSYVPVFRGFGIIPLISATILWTAMGPLEKESL